MRELLQVLKAVADKNRIRIIKMLEKKKMCVCELSAVLEITQPSVSKHLSILNHAGIIKGERNGQWVDYSLCTEKINQYASVMQDTIKNWLNDDLVIESDQQETKTLCRESLCKRK